MVMVVEMCSEFGVIRERMGGIEFVESSHEYIRNGERYTPVSVLLKSVYEEFQTDKVISNITKNPRSEYYSMSSEDIKKMWGNKNKVSKEFGRILHKVIEETIETGVEVSELGEDIVSHYYYWLEFWDKFRRCVGGIRECLTECIVYSDVYKVAGTFDCLVKGNNELVYLLDWKTNQADICRDYQKVLKPPLDMYVDTTLMHYILQVSVYRYILAMEYGVHPHYLYVVHLKRDGVDVYDVPFLSSEANYILSMNLTKQGVE